MAALPLFILDPAVLMQALVQAVAVLSMAPQLCRTMAVSLSGTLAPTMAARSKRRFRVAHAWASLATVQVKALLL
jgi:hypothetical protein